MNSLVKWLDRKFYPGTEDNWDDHLFRELIMRFCQPESHILDVGAGAGIVSPMNFKGQVARVCGIDPDSRVTQNPYLDEGKVAMAEHIPYDDSTFDIVFSDNVLEHLDNPEEVFAEVRRVLKPGGTFLVKTPNKLHYVPLVATLTPHRFHRFFNKLRGRKEADTFPTRYRANTPQALRKISDQVNLSIQEVRLIESRPEYLRINPVTYVVGILYERLVNRFDTLSRFRVLLMGVMCKSFDSE